MSFPSSRTLALSCGPRSLHGWQRLAGTQQARVWPSNPGRRSSSTFECLNKSGDNVVDIFQHALRCGAIIAHEWPDSCTYWDRPDVRAFFASVHPPACRATLAGCSVGVVSCDPETYGLPMKKTWRISDDFPHPSGRSRPPVSLCQLPCMRRAPVSILDTVRSTLPRWRVSFTPPSSRLSTAQGCSGRDRLPLRRCARRQLPAPWTLVAPAAAAVAVAVGCRVPLAARRRGARRSSNIFARTVWWGACRVMVVFISLP
jgi:hypothetical protein